jgi:type II secretory pathway component GspD/PulD (secretin)
VADLDKEGFQWDIELSDRNSRVQPLDNLTDAAYNYDINGDGELESIPFYRRPDGSSVLNNTFTESVLGAIASPGPPGSFNLASMITDNEDGDKISVIFDYLNSLEESELLSAPRVTTMNQKPAAVVDLRQEWFVTQVFNNVNTTTGGFGAQPTTVVTQSLTPSVFMFGITLSVTPQIADNQIRLWLNPQVNSKVGEKVIPQSLFINDEEVTNFLILPEESMQSVWTNVIVNNGDTVVLGGLVTDRSIRAEERFPYLADIPLLGYFFRGKSAEIRQSSLLIFVTPTIIDTTGAEYFDSDSRL